MTAKIRRPDWGIDVRVLGYRDRKNIAHVNAWAARRRERNVWRRLVRRVIGRTH